ncbi:hypothetical protein [Pelosinus sp. sgz500959]|uniref:hypothetical protein n=1 Tax=Pelosinus sp. sgz500959 TaxID=3242472 RepID=UPI00366E77A6
MMEIKIKDIDLTENPEQKAPIDTSEKRSELSDDSGEKKYKCELPDDSGEFLAEKSEQKVPSDTSEKRSELPDDSGEKKYKCELPDDSGEFLAEKSEEKAPIDTSEKRSELPDDSGEKKYKYELPDDSGEFFQDSIKGNEIQEAKGGRYGDLKKQDDREGKEVHHMPAKDVSHLKEADGPAIIMDEKDHRKTGSCGNSKDAQAYREEQQKLIKEGNFREAFEMDVEDIREKFGDKYEEAIAEAEEYLDKLESEGKLKTEEKTNDKEIYR